MKLIDYIIKLWVYISIVVLFFILYNLLTFIIFRGIKGFSLNFLLLNLSGMPLGSEGGIKNAIVGSIFLMIIAIIFSVILGVSCALYNTIYCKNNAIKNIINIIIYCMSSIPSIIIGLFVYGFLIVKLNIPRSMLTAGISLGLMVFPFVEIRTEKIILNIDSKIFRESYNLNINNDYMCKNLIYPIIKKEILSTGILAGSYAIGATAPILLTGAVFVGGDSNKLLSPVMSLSFHLHMLLSQGIFSKQAYATAFVLIIILILLQILSEVIIRGIKH